MRKAVADGDAVAPPGRRCGIIDDAGPLRPPPSFPANPMLDPAVHARLAALLQPAALLPAAEDTKPYECDGLTMYREQPAAVAIPDNEAQVVEILKQCHAARLPVVARG